MLRAVGVAVLLATGAAGEEGWITHAVALAPDLETTVRGRMHAERGTQRLQIGEREQKAWGPIRAFAFRPSGRQFVATNDTGPLRVLDTATGKVVAELHGHRGWVHAVAFAGGRVASAGYDKTLRVWDAQTGQALWCKDEYSGAVALTPDGACLASTDRSGHVHLWDAKTGQKLRSLATGDGRWHFTVAFSANGRRVAAAARRARVFDVATGATVATISVHEKKVTALALSPDGAHLATADQDRHVKLWRVAAPRHPEHAWRTEHTVGALRFAQDGRTLGAATYYAGTHRWPLGWRAQETLTDAMLLSLTFFDDAHGVAVGGRGERDPGAIATTADGGRTWTARDAPHRGRLYGVAALDGRTAIAVGFDGLVLRTEDRGRTWTRVAAPVKGWLAAVHFASARVGFIVGGRGGGPALWKTGDGGRTWQSLADRLPKGESLRAVHFATERRGLTVGTGGLILTTADGGATWTRRDAGVDTWLRAIHVAGDTVHVAGRGVLLRSRDAGATWESRPLPQRRKWNAVRFVDPRTGWLTNFAGEVLETSDGGATWTTVHKHGDATFALHATAERILVTTGDGTVLWRLR